MLLRGLALLWLAGSLAATHPTVTSIVPRGGQRGTEITLTITGSRLQGIRDLLLVRPGIQVLAVKAERADRATVRIKIAPDCPLGTHEVFVRTDRGLSNMKLFMVGCLPEVTETEPNNGRDQAQLVALNTTVNGRIRNEDVDVFAIDVKQGQRVTVEVEGLRLGDLEFDPHLTIHDQQGSRLAMVDDTIFAQMDPLTTVTCARDGRWFVTLRENARGGSDNSHYRLHVGTFPRPLVAFPAGGPPGSVLKTRLVGAAADDVSEHPVQLAATAGLHATFVTTARGTTPTPIQLVASDKPNVFEASHQRHPPGAGISAWHFLGPFANPRDKGGRSLGHRTVYPPEQKLDLAAEYAGRDGKIRWSRQNALRDNATHDLRQLVKQPEHAVVYLARTLEAATPRRVLFLFSADDTARVWCNGKLVLDDARPSSVVASQHRLLLDLRKGRNELLVKISNRGGPLAFHSRLLDPLRYADYGSFPVPAAINGIIEKPNEQDRFAFLARQGEQIDFQVVSRRLRSPLDPVVGIYCSHERFYVGNDDTRGIGLDSLVRFRAPFTGEFVLSLRDMLLDAGPRHVYRIEVSRPTARPLALHADLPGYRYEYTVAIPKGGRDAIMIAATNLDRSAGVQLAFPDLPAGVQASVPPFDGAATAVPVVFRAAADAAPAGRLLRVTATATKKQLDLGDARFYQPVEVVQARNQQTFLRRPLDRLPVAVVEPTPFQIEVPALPVPLVRSSSLRVPFRIARTKGSKQAVRVRMLYNPAGVTSSQATVAADKSSGYLTLYASDGAGIGTHKIVLVAAGAAAGGTVSSSSELTDLAVATPWMTAAVGAVRTEPGKTVSLPITFAAAKPFTGKIVAEWIGLPRGIRCAPLNLQRDTKKVDLRVDIAADAAPGRHRSFRLRLKIETPQGWIVQDFRSGEIRVDRPTTKRTGS